MEKADKALALAEDNAAKIELLAKKLGSGGSSGGSGGKLRVAELEPLEGYYQNFFGEITFKEKTLVIARFSSSSTAALSLNGQVIGMDRSPIVAVAEPCTGQLVLEFSGEAKAILVGSFTVHGRE